MCEDLENLSSKCFSLTITLFHKKHLFYLGLNFLKIIISLLPSASLLASPPYSISLQEIIICRSFQLCDFTYTNSQKTKHLCEYHEKLLINFVTSSPPPAFFPHVELSLVSKSYKYNLVFVSFLNTRERAVSKKAYL